MVAAAWRAAAPPERSWGRYFRKSRARGIRPSGRRALESADTGGVSGLEDRWIDVRDARAARSSATAIPAAASRGKWGRGRAVAWLAVGRRAVAWLAVG